MGDFSAGFHRPDGGIHTVEGNVAGARAAFLERQRQQDQDAYERKRQQLAASSASGGIAETSSIAAKFATGKFGGSKETGGGGITTVATSAAEGGLMTAQDWKAKALAENDSSQSNKEQKRKAQEKTEEELKKERKQKKKRLKEQKKMLSTLSFAGQEEEEEKNQEDEPKQKTTKPVIKKNPTVDTSFLADPARDAALQQERERLQQEWLDQQERMKQTQLEIVYSYWDGSGHRRKVVCQQGDTVGAFLEKARQDLAATEFKELQHVAADALLYVKEDLILPADVTFYDLIATKARGKSGPLFHFDVHDDVRVGPVDARIEKDESHPGKIVERRWYERNKHIFPASRWEVYDPTKDYGTYTIGGKEVNSKKSL